MTESSGHEIKAALPLPGCTLHIAPEWLFERMSAAGQGWHLRSEFGDMWPLPAGMDQAVIEASRLVASQGGRLAIGVPRVVTGMALGPVIYTAINLLIQRDRVRASSSAPGFVPFPFPANAHIVLASRSHAIRDMLAESLVQFGTRHWRLCHFPTYRMRRNGSLEPCVYGRLTGSQRPRRQDLLATATPIVVYDYWPLSSKVGLPRVGALFAELSEAWS
jgi:hypothetical protein